MANFVIHQDVWKALDNFRLPETLGFGLVPAPVMYSATFENGVWSQGQLLPYGPIQILPGARALHFAEQAFEGMKAYRVGVDVALDHRVDALQALRRASRHDGGAGGTIL